jgi:SulP family sulfate permease
LPSLAGLELGSILPAAVAIAALGAIESLLSAVATDSMARLPRHSSDQELVGQGIANLVSALFGGLPVTGVIVRSSVAVQAGGKTRLTSLAHSIALLGMMMLAAPLVSRVPIAGLAGVLVFVGLRLIEWRELVKLWRASRFEAGVFLVTAAGIVFADFIEGVAVGLVLALVVHARASGRLEVLQTERAPSVLRLEGPICFVTHTELERLSERVVAHRVVLDLYRVSSIDATGLHALHGLIDNLKARGVTVFMARARDLVKLSLERSGITRNVGGSRLYATVEEAAHEPSPIAMRTGT